MGEEECNTILSSDRPIATLLHALEEKGVIQPSKVDRLEEALLGLKSPSSYHAVNLYQRLKDQITSYDRFLATLSTHLTSSVPAKLCDYFFLSDEQKDRIISSQNPGLSLLLVLDETGVIKPSEVRCLEEPFNKVRLVQALAKTHRYKESLEEENRQLLQISSYSLEDKRALFVEFLKKKIRSWYDTMTPVPWKRSCQWKSTDLFVGSGLILTDSKAKQCVQNIDEQCKLNYTEIFTHETLNSEIRIILEGEPGAGKTMLSSQLAYDWSQGKIDGVDILIFLPLKIVEDKTLVQATKEFYIPTNSPISENEIESILASDTERICLLLDGMEEYNPGGKMRAKESSEVMKIMKKEKHSNCKAVITSRSDVANDLPECPLLKLGTFGETERNSYIEKLFPRNTDKQQKLKKKIQDNPFILDLCRVPLLFVLVVHNIESKMLSEQGQLSKLSPFIRGMIFTLCPSNTVKDEVNGIRSKSFKTAKMTLAELAFNGLCKGRQQLSWQKDFMEINVGSIKLWVDSGILVLEEGLVKIKGKRKGTQKQEGKGKGKIEKNPEEDSSEQPNSKKKEADKSEVAPDEMLMKRFLERSTSHDISQLPVLSEDIVTASKVEHEVSKTEEQHQSVSELETEQHVIKRKTDRRAADQVPLTVKFLHKVIQEWFAATFFCSMMRRCTSEDQFQNYVSSQLQHISPTDLHYVLRFTSYLHPQSCHVIMNYLLRNYRKDGSVPPYIMNCVFLCFKEYNDVKGPDMRNVVIDVCKEVVTIRSEDSRLLQQAKSTLLAYASNDGVIIEKLELRDVIFAVNKTSLTLNSGVELGILHTVKAFVVSRWDLVLQEEDYKNILKFLSAGALLKEVCCIFPKSPPDSLDKITLEKIESKNLKVKWHIGYLVQSLDPRTGTWMINVKQPGTTLGEISEVSADQGSTKDEEEMQEPISSSLPSTSSESNQYSNTQGTLKQIGSVLNIGVVLPEKKAKVFLEPDVSKVTQVLQAGTVGDSEHKDVLDEIRVRSVDGRNFEENAIALHEYAPDPVHVLSQLTGSHLFWEEQKDVSYHVEDTTCIMLLKSFSWYTYCIDDEIVIAKKIVVYAAAQNPKPNDDVVRIEVGCYPDVPGGDKEMQGGQNLTVVHKKILYFVKSERQHPLQISLKDIFPSGWQCRCNCEFPDTHSKEILYDTISEDFGDSCVYMIAKSNSASGRPLCVFTASQKKDREVDNITVQLAVNFQVIDKLPSSTGATVSRLESSLKAETNVTKSGVQLEIPETGVVLNIPPNAFEGNIENHLVGMRIIPSRIIEDQVTSLCSNSCTAVEIFPNTIKLRRPAELRLPHCLTFNENSNRTAKIFTNNGQGSPAQWKNDPNVLYTLDNKACVITLNKLCCVQFIIDDDIVKGKIIRVYTAAKEVKESDEVAELEVGYHPDVPGGGELLRMNPTLEVDSKKRLVFMGKRRSPLQLSLDDIVPSRWTCWFPKDKPPDIPFEVIAASIEHSHLFILQKARNEVGSVTCRFTALQKEGKMATELAITVFPKEDNSNENARLQEKANADFMTSVFKYLSEHIGREWRKVGRNLGLQDAELDHIEVDNPRNTQEVIYQMLVKWKRRQGSNATYDILINALEQSGRRDLAQNE